MVNFVTFNSPHILEIKKYIIAIKTFNYQFCAFYRSYAIVVIAMAPLQSIATDKITKEEFDDLLSQYPDLIEQITSSKPGALHS